MDIEETDVVVIGMGPGGEDAAGRLAEAGLQVTGVEARLVGGECPYWGCVPSKMMIRAANLLAEARRVPGLAGASTVEPDWDPVARRIRQEATDSWDDKVAACGRTPPAHEHHHLHHHHGPPGHAIAPAAWSPSTAGSAPGDLADRGLGHVHPQFAVLGGIFVAFEVLAGGAVGFTAGRLGAWLSRRRRARQALDAGSGTIMGALAGRPALGRWPVAGPDSGLVNLTPRMPRASGNRVLFRSPELSHRSLLGGAAGTRRLTRSGSAGTAGRMEGS
jgi:hypothetical protein